MTDLQHEMEGRLIVTEQGRDRLHELCDERTIIGRAAHVDLHLRDPNAAPTHCEVRRTAHGFKLIDLETVSGTLVNGNTVNQHLLKDGDTIRIGEAKLTFLGVSAVPPPPPRHAPPPPLTTHPRDEEGQPRRFYRHETRARGSGAKAFIVVGAVALIGLLITWAASGKTRNEGAEQLAEAETSLALGTAAGLQEGLEKLETLPPGTLNERDLERKILEAKARLERLRQEEVDARADREYQRILAFLKGGPEDESYLRSQITWFRESFPESYRLADLQARLQRAESGGDDGIAFWTEKEAALRSAFSERNFAAAFAIVGELEAHPVVGRTKSSRISTYRKTLEREFEQHYGAEAAKATEAAQRGDRATARSIYEAIVTTGIEPYASQAKLLLDRLK